jgi:hypothetical protein
MSKQTQLFEWQFKPSIREESNETLKENLPHFGPELCFVSKPRSAFIEWPLKLETEDFHV